MKEANRTLLVAATLVLVMLLGGSLLLTNGSAVAAQSTPLEPLLCFQVYNPGSTQANLAVIPTQGDNADDYQVTRDYVPATGVFQEVAVLSGQLSTTLPVESHWVRARNAQGSSPWVECESYERLSFIDASTSQDFRRPLENIEFGLDGAGDVQAGDDNGNSYGIFTGLDGDIVVADASNAPELAPNGGKMAWRVRFRIALAELTFLQNVNGNSWNLMQRGLADDPGGQYKMSLVARPDDSVRIECVASDFNGGTDNIRALSSVDIADLTLTNGLTPWINATCLMDDTGEVNGPGTGDGLQVIVNGIGDPERIDPDFGTLLPSAQNTCSNGTGTALDPTLFPGGIGHVVTVGNKPACYTPNTNDDAFIGHVDFAEIWLEAPITNPPTEFCNDLEVTVDIGDGDVPTLGDDVIMGTSGPDSINGLAGDDTICGLGGNDVINGGNGVDTIFGGAGEDRISGQGGNDFLHGDADDDIVNGGVGEDFIWGGDGDDDLRGQGQNDILYGQGGVDQIFGGSGNDEIDTGDGGNAGTTQAVRGQSNNDIIFGSNQADVLEGGPGLDEIWGLDGDDTLIGGLGSDELRGEGGNDRLEGGATRDFLYGGIGNDDLLGGLGNDDLYGEAGDDTLNGQGNLDLCSGGVGTDTATTTCETILGVP